VLISRGANALEDVMVAHSKCGNCVHLRESTTNVFGALAGVETNLFVTEECGETPQLVNRRGTRRARSKTRTFKDQSDALSLQRFIVKRTSRQVVDAVKVRLALFVDGEKVSTH
jgi:hypothetical protein